MKIYKFLNHVTIDLDSIVGIDEIRYIDGMRNLHSDYSEYYYDIFFTLSQTPLRRYNEDKTALEQEKKKLIETWEDNCNWKNKLDNIGKE